MRRKEKGKEEQSETYITMMDTDFWRIEQVFLFFRTKEESSNDRGSLCEECQDKYF